MNLKWKCNQEKWCFGTKIWQKSSRSLKITSDPAQKIKKNTFALLISIWYLPSSSPQMLGIWIIKLQVPKMETLDSILNFSSRAVEELLAPKHYQYEHGCHKVSRDTPVNWVLQKMWRLVIHSNIDTDNYIDIDKLWYFLHRTSSYHIIVTWSEFANCI